ncbi:MAG: hypothetical protein HYZ00_09370 [Candidatus Hydrogenedentes bacterium]|nr:hypothetical protein [Candidatus Hydrogenedentota bacterium]
MNYRIELYDHAGLRRARIEEVPLFEITLGGADSDDLIRGLLPPELPACDIGWRLRVLLEEMVIADAVIESLAPQWGDTKKLILDRYVAFHQVLEATARSSRSGYNPRVTRLFRNARIDDIARGLINTAQGPVHYTVAHTAYPGGAQREHTKFLARKTPENALEIGGISAGQWVDSARINLAGAYARDGDTIAGLVVDGQPWPDLRLMMIDCEETSRNSHAIARHPEVADWDDARYLASGYYRRAVTARDLLQNLIDAHGIGYIELNPHRDASGAFDDRVDAYGRYLGLVFGGSECFNAALVENNLADVYLYDEGRYLAPELALKEFYSYTGPAEDTIEACATVLESFEADAGLLELLATLAYSAPGFVLDVQRDGRIALRAATRPQRVLFFDSARHGAAFGASGQALANILYFSGNPLRGAFQDTYVRGESADAFGAQGSALAHFAFSTSADSARLAEGLLDDLAYPALAGEVTIFGGDPCFTPGMLVELREDPLRRLHEQLPEESGGRFMGKLVARVASVRHRIFGRQVETVLVIDPPLRSVRSPLDYLVRSQRSEDALYALRLDDDAVGLDLGFHLD